MIVPLLTYCGNLHIVLTKTQKRKLASLEERYKNLIENTAVQPIEQRLLLRACIYVKKCLNEKVCDDFKNYFKLIKHQKNTRNNNFILRLPPAKLAFFRKSFAFAGAKIYNELPIDLRLESSLNDFKVKAKQHFRF